MSKSTRGKIGLYALCIVASGLSMATVFSGSYYAAVGALAVAIATVVVAFFVPEE